MGASTTISSETAEMLLNLFPDCGKTELLDLLERCCGDLNYTINNLLDSGYLMNGSEDTQRRSRASSLSIAKETEVFEKLVKATADDEADLQTLNILNTTTTPRNDACAIIHENDPSPRSPTEPELDLERYKRQGARPKFPLNDPHRLIFDDISEDSGVPVSECSAGSTCGSDNNDSDRSSPLELELPKDFVKNLVALYGAPGVGAGTDSGSNEDNLTAGDLLVEITPDMAFDLFRYLNINVTKRQVQAQERETILKNEEQQQPTTTQNRNASKKRRKKRNRNRSATPTSQNTNATYGNIDSNTATTEMDEEEEDDLEQILQQIEDMERESTNSMPHQEQTTFQAIMDEDSTKVGKELERLQSMRNKKRSMAQTLKYFQLKNYFPSLKPQFVEEICLQCDYDLDKSVNYLVDMYPSRYVAGVEKQVVTPVARTRCPSGTVVYYDPDVVAQMSPTEKRSTLDVAEYYRIELEDYQQKYEETRSTTNKHKLQAQAYSFYLSQATQLQHKVYATLTEYSFYTLIGLNAGNKNPNKIDLHGLSVRYALGIVNKYLNNRKAWVMNNLPVNSHVTVTIITGQGRHSVNNIPKLNPAVRNFLMEHHYSFRDGECVGNFIVHIENRKSNKKHQPGSKSK